MTESEKSGIIVEDNPFGDIQEVVHDQDCWKYHGLCAIHKLSEIDFLLSIAKKKIDTVEIIKIIKG